MKADLPLGLHSAREEHALDHADSPRAEDINEGVASLLGRDLHLLLLVRDALDQRGDQRHEERLQSNMKCHDSPRHTLSAQLCSEFPFSSLKIYQF